ncbi:MAG: hypothetical protein DMG06_23100 [Acidobacteria bacterium]|nr:MAG: hypothetical protein DMG06_23100 [Acidobacteriota bacterium]
MGQFRQVDHLQFKAPPAVLRDYDIYLTIYSRLSLPVVWRQISNSEESISPVKSFYLIRIHPRCPEASDWKTEIQRQFAFCIQNLLPKTRKGGGLTWLGYRAGEPSSNQSSLFWSIC